MSIFPLFSVLVLPWTFLILVIPSFASILTATIDDSAGDSLNPGVQPVYSPSDAFSPNSNCDGCLARPDPGNAFDNSWHDTSQFGGASPRSVTLSFTGIGIDVFCILANTVPGAATNTNLVFTIDGTPYPPFSRDPDETTNYLYNQNVLSVNGLSQSAHTLVISTNNASGTLLLFDYARYSYEVPDTTTTAVVHVVTSTSTTQTTATDTRKLSPTAAQTSIGSSPSDLSPSSQSGGTSSPPMQISSASASSSSTSADPPISAPGSTDSPISSSSNSSPAVIISPHRSSHIPVLLGTIIPLLLITVAGVLCWRRRRTRVNTLDTESQSGRRSIAPSVHNDDSPQGLGAEVAMINSEAHNAQGRRGRWDLQADEHLTMRDPVVLQEKYNADISQNHNPPSSPFTNTLDDGPPPVYSFQRPLPTVPAPA